ncbi:MAG: hypothetical protein N3E44_03230 [Candidatus Bathyarchaeota archaeon]|nr:hypothetical protein [Candidatus Bathyarchaeota archaeon]
MSMLSYRSIVAVSLVIAILGVASTFYLNSKYNLVLNDYTKLRIDYTSLSDDHRKLKESFNDLLSRYRRLNESYVRLNASYTSVSHEYDVLMILYEELEDHYDELQSRYNALMDDYMALRYMYNRLNESYSILESMYESLTENYSILQRSFDELNIGYRDIQLEYIRLRSSYDKLLGSYEALKARYTNLSRNYEVWRRYMLSYLSFPDSIPRVLSDDEIGRFASLVQALITYPLDYWLSIEEIYMYIKNHVGYADDPPIPYPPTASSLEAGYYKPETYDRIILSPMETLKRGYGDSEDQSILLYALIKAYERYMHGREYVVWILDIALIDGKRHMAVAIPAQGGGIAIIDVAEGYYTGDPSSLKPLDSYMELISYSSLFIHHEGIESVAIYTVRSGRLIRILEGDLHDMIDFVKQLA